MNIAAIGKLVFLHFFLWILMSEVVSLDAWDFILNWNDRFSYPRMDLALGDYSFFA